MSFVMALFMLNINQFSKICKRVSSASNYSANTTLLQRSVFSHLQISPHHNENGHDCFLDIDVHFCPTFHLSSPLHFNLHLNIHLLHLQPILLLLHELCLLLLRQNNFLSPPQLFSPILFPIPSFTYPLSVSHNYPLYLSSFLYYMDK